MFRYLGLNAKMKITIRGNGFVLSYNLNKI